MIRYMVKYMGDTMRLLVNVFRSSKILDRYISALERGDDMGALYCNNELYRRTMERHEIFQGSPDRDLEGFTLELLGIDGHNLASRINFRGEDKKWKN